jgi:hypothetical protein
MLEIREEAEDTVEAPYLIGGFFTFVLTDSI